MELKVLKNEAPDIHPSAVIHPSAIIHKNVVIGAYAYIGENCEIGEGTIIGPHAVIAKNVRMGKENHIYPHAVIGEDPQDLKFADEYSTVVIGDHNLLREYVTIHRATGENCETRIGSYNMLQPIPMSRITAALATTSSCPPSRARQVMSLSKTMRSSAA